MREVTRPQTLKTGRGRRWLGPAGVALLVACDSGADSKPAPQANAAAPKQAAAPEPEKTSSRPATPEGWHDGLSVAEEELATVEDFQDTVEKHITPKTWRAELERLAKELSD